MSIVIASLQRQNGGSERWNHLPKVTQLIRGSQDSNLAPRAPALNYYAVSLP